MHVSPGSCLTGNNRQPAVMCHLYIIGDKVAGSPGSLDAWMTQSLGVGESIDAGSKIDGIQEATVVNVICVSPQTIKVESISTANREYRLYGRYLTHLDADCLAPYRQ